jgi:hypothetical protein
LLHFEKSLIDSASRQKIALPIPRIDNPAVDSGPFFPPPTEFFYIPPSQKSLPVLEGRFFHSLMPEKLRPENSGQ